MHYGLHLDLDIRGRHNVCGTAAAILERLEKQQPALCLQARAVEKQFDKHLNEPGA